MIPCMLVVRVTTLKRPFHAGLTHAETMPSSRSRSRAFDGQAPIAINLGRGRQAVNDRASVGARPEQGGSHRLLQPHRPGPFQPPEQSRLGAGPRAFERLLAGSRHGARPGREPAAHLALQPADGLGAELPRDGEGPRADQVVDRGPGEPRQCQDLGKPQDPVAVLGII